MTPPPQQPRRDRDLGARRVVVLPDVDGNRTLTEEFGERLPIETIERTVAAARHALERSHQLATPEAVNRLAREQLRARVATLTSRPAIGLH